MVNKQTLLLASILSILSSVVSFQHVSLSPLTDKHIKIEQSFTPETIATLSSGYGNTLASMLWFGLLNYYGGTEIENRRYTYIGNKLKTIILMNPYMESAYFMAAAMLPWETHSTKISRPLLERAMQTMPNNWRWPYYRGFNAYWFDHDIKTAAKYMAQAAHLPDAPPIITNLAARMQSESGDLDTALAFLYNLHNNKQDPALKKQLEKQIKAIQTEQVLRRVDQLLAKTPAWKKGERNLDKLGIHLPKTLPDGGHIIMNAKGIPVSSISRKRFKVFVPPKRQKDMQRKMHSNE